MVVCLSQGVYGKGFAKVDDAVMQFSTASSTLAPGPMVVDRLFVRGDSAEVCEPRVSKFDICRA